MLGVSLAYQRAEDYEAILAKLRLKYDCQQFNISY